MAYVCVSLCQAKYEKTKKRSIACAIDRCKPLGYIQIFIVPLPVEQVSEVGGFFLVCRLLLAF